MYTIKYINKLVPDLNYWVNRTLYNNSFNMTMIKCPTKISDFWRSRDSVVDIIFNETSDPSGDYYDGYHFMYKYRTINIHRLALTEPVLFKRVQVYYNNTWIYAPKDDEKYADIMNLNDSSITVGEEDYDYPYGVKPTKYVNYKTHIATSGSDQFQYNDADYNPESESGDDYIIYAEEENVFDLTEEELDMLENLYLYRIGDYDNIDVNSDMYYHLESPLSMWICTYLMCYMYDYVNYQHLKTLCNESNGCFRCLAEKHLQDRVYEYIQKHNLSLWENVLDSKIRDKRTFVPYTMMNNTCIQKGRIQQDDIQSMSIQIKDIDKKPEDYNNFEFILDGKKLKQGEDYKITNIYKESKPKMKVEIINNNLELTPNQKYQFMYNYVVIKSPISGLDNNFESNI